MQGRKLALVVLSNAAQVGGYAFIDIGH